MDNFYLLKVKHEHNIRYFVFPEIEQGLDAELGK
jgi:hypothetical protein